MLQKLDMEPELNAADFSYLLQPAYYLGLLKRRWPFFLVPFLSILLVGAGVGYFWPPTYFSEGKILVQSQQIPTELVRPTVTSAAQERIQVIEQRTMTRDNLLGIVEKFKLFPERRTLMSPTQLVELMKKSIKIEPVAQPLAFSRTTSQNPTVIFTVGFEYSDPQNAARVANELVTRILDLDLRDRTSRATDTTKFLAREVQRLQAESSQIDAKLAQAKLSPVRSASRSNADEAATQLAHLRADLAAKSAIYSDRNYQVQALKRQIEALQKIAPQHSETATNDSVAPSAAGQNPDVDALETQQKSVQANLEVATQKLAAARLGEKLEQDQQSEKLEVIDQPTQPQEPIRPNRPKIAGIVIALALMAGAAIAVGAELLDKAIRRSSDLYSVVDSELVISVPYIYTESELRYRKKRFYLVTAMLLLMAMGGAAAAYWFLPPFDLLIAKARVGVYR
jgi:capsular polysaccharide biosynthesis protein